MNRIKTTTDIVYNNATKKDIIIVHLSDIHFNTTTKLKQIEKIKDEIIKINPNYIMITGDTLDNPEIIKNKEKIKVLLYFLKSIAEKYKILISLGNHDIMTEYDYKFFRKLNELVNIYVLDNNSYLDDYIFVSGFTLPNNYYYNVSKKESVDILLYHLEKNKKLTTKLPSTVPKIALIHSPIKLTDKSVINKLSEYDLILSGHTHGGMVPDLLRFLFPSNTGLIAPNKRFFPKIAKGRIDKKIANKEITIIINEAITKLSKVSGKIFHKLNFVYNSSINKIIIRKKRRY